MSPTGHKSASISDLMAVVSIIRRARRVEALSPRQHIAKPPMVFRIVNVTPKRLDDTEIDFFDIEPCATR